MSILRTLPDPIISSPERVLLKFAVATIGIGLLVNAHNRDSTLAAFPTWAVYELGVTFLLGGTSALIGIFRRTRHLERFGVAATAFASLSYAIAIAVVYGPSRFAGIIIFGGVALACATRLVVSAAAVQVVIAARAYARQSETRR